MAFSMMSHALRMLWANLGNAARVSVVPIILMYVVLIVLGGGVFFAMGMGGMFDGSDVTSDVFTGVEEGDPAFGFFGFLTIFAMFLVAMVFLAWIAISWHRFILLEEYPSGWVPPFRWEEIKSYVWKLIVLSFVFMILTLIPALVIGFALSAADASDAIGASILIIAIIAIIGLPIFIWISFRLSSVLPASAIGEPMGIGEAWRATATHSGTIFWFGLVYLGVSIVIQIVISILGLIPILGLLVAIFGSWFTTILGFSALTTVYGVAVQGREPT